MTYINAIERQRQLDTTSGIDQDSYGFSDAFSIAAEETIRTLPTASILRGVTNYFDSSEKLDPAKANMEYNLEGEAAFGLDEEVTVSKAKARQEDQSRLMMNSHIQGLYAQESPTGSILANVTGSLAAGFVDPTLMAINIGAGVAVAKGIQAGVAGLRAGTYSSAAGQAMLRTLEMGSAQTVTSIVAREAAENVLASVVEESINFAGIGEERLARKVTTQESLRNIAIGTVFGTGIGAGIGVVGLKKATKGVTEGYGRKFGDSAPEILDTDVKVGIFENKIGAEPSNIVRKQYNTEIYESKSWFDVAEDKADYSASPKDGKYYLAIDKDKVHSFSNRGDSLVLSSNPAMAQNVGTKVREIDVADLNLYTPDQFTGNTRVKTRLVNNIIDDFIMDTDSVQANNVISKIVDSGFSANVNKKQLRSIIKEELAAKESLEDVIEMMEGLSAASGVDYDIHRVISDTLEDAGFDGYSFKGKNALDEDAYTGLALTNFGATKAKTAKEFDVAAPSPKAKEEFNMQRQAATKEYAEQVSASSKNIIQEIDEDMGLEQSLSPVPVQSEVNIKNELVADYQEVKIVKQAIDAKMEKLKQVELEGKLTKEQVNSIDLLEANTNEAKFNQITDQTFAKIKEYKDSGCL